MTRTEIADHAARKIMEDYGRHPLNFTLVKMVILSALLDAANQELEQGEQKGDGHWQQCSCVHRILPQNRRSLEDSRRQLAAIRGDDAI